MTTGRTGASVSVGHPTGTLIACAVVLIGFLLAVAQLTGGLSTWTFEARRRALVEAEGLPWPATRLVDSSGRPWSMPVDRSGTVMLVDFIYTRCASVCQSLGTAFEQAQQQIDRDGSSVRLLSVSIDPLKDTPTALADHARRHHADARLWTLAAPVSVDEDRRLRRALGIVAIPDGVGGFAHNGAIHLVDATGRVVGIFDTSDWAQALAQARALAKGPR